MSHKILSDIQKTYDKLITEPNLMNVFCDKVVCVPFHHRKVRVGEIIGTEDCHEVYLNLRPQLTLGKGSGAVKENYHLN